jgi:hypothetical protein
VISFPLAFPIRSLLRDHPAWGLGVDLTTLNRKNISLLRKVQKSFFSYYPEKKEEEHYI